MKLLRLNIQLFASGSNSTTLSSGAGNKATLSVSFNETNASDPDIANNKTTISASATMKMTSGSFSVSSTWHVRLYWHDNKSNKDVEVANEPVSALSRNQSVTASASFDVEHNSDGTLSGYAIAKWDATGGSYTPYAGQVDTGWIALTTIPRTSKIGNHSGNIGYNLPISWSRASNSFTHTLKISFGGKSYTYSGLATSYNWNVPTELYSVMSGKSGNGTLTLTTYSGSNAIGTETATLSLSAVEADVNPLLKNQPKNVIDTNDSTLALTNSSNVIIAHKSLAQLQLTFSTRGYAKAKKLIVNNVERTIPAGVVDQNNSSITKYDVVIDLGTITSNKINISVTDTREYPVPDVYEIAEDNFINYIPLDISPTFKRVAPTTGEVGLQFSGNYFNNTFGKVDNSLTISYKYKEKYEEQYSELITLVKDVDYKIVDNTYHSGSGEYKSVLVLNDTFDYKKLYEFQLFVNDSVTTLPTIVAIITKGVPIFWWNGEKVVVNGELYVADTDGENATKIANSYPIGSIYTSENDTNPKDLFGGEWELVKTYTGGELIGYATIWAQGGSQINSGTDTEFSHTKIGTKHPNVINYTPNVLTYNGGTIWVDPKGIVGLVEAIETISGAGGSGLRGLWWKGNYNTLPTGVESDGNATLLTGPIDGNYGGNSNTYFYHVADGVTEGFYVNPMFSPYNGAFTPGISGTISWLKVKAYAKVGTSYVWKRIA